MKFKINFPTSLIAKLWKLLSKKWKFKVLLLVVFMFITGLAEMVTLGSVVPFLAAIVDPASVLEYPYLSDVLNYFQIKEEKELIAFLSFFFCFAVIVSACLRLLIARLNFNWCYKLIAELTIEGFEKTLYQPYLVHTSRNSSELIGGITVKLGGILGHVILPVITSFQMIILTLSIIAALLVILPFSNIIALGSFACFYGVISIFLRRKLDHNSKIVAFNEVDGIKVLQESLSGIRDISLGNYYDVYIEQFSQGRHALAEALGANKFIIIAPRFVVEALGIVLIVSLAFVNYSISDSPTNALPSIGALAFGAQRLLPYLQNLYAAYATLMSGHQSVEDGLDLLDQSIRLKEIIDDQRDEINFNRSIELQNVSFAYTQKSKFSLKKIDLKINKGQILGIIGSTGGGKSTLIDLFLGLIQPKEGAILIDGKILSEFDLANWQRKIFHVPQQIFIADTSIKKNIALGHRDEFISMNKIIECSKKAQLEDYINTLPLGYETIVGERGAKLSGGQRQRIGIARALYKGGSVLFLDEATNALDMKTESNIIQIIKNLEDDLTIIIVAHNLDTVKDCDKLIILDQGTIVEEGTFSEIKGSKNFKKVSGDLI